MPPLTAERLRLTHLPSYERIKLFIKQYHLENLYTHDTSCILNILSVIIVIKLILKYQLRPSL